MNPSEFNLIRQKYKQGIMLPQATIGDLVKVIDELDGALAYMQACFSMVLDTHRELMRRLTDVAATEDRVQIVETAAQFEMIVRLLAAGNLEAAQAILNPAVVNETAD